MRKLLLVFVVALIAVPSMATITWEAHYNNGDKNADYAASGPVTPFSESQSTTPLLPTGGRDGSGGVAPVASTNSMLNYRANPTESTPNVNMVQGTMSVWVKPNFSSTQTTPSGSIIDMGSYESISGHFINLYWEGISSSRQWRWNLGRGDSTSDKFALRSNDWGVHENFTAGDWVNLAMSWKSDNGTGNGVMQFYVNGVLSNTREVTDGWDVWNAWNLSVGNAMEDSLPYGGQFDGTIDDVVFSDVFADTSIFNRVPEPATLTLLAAGLGFAIVRRRK